MIRHAAAVAVGVCLIPSWLCAQTTEFTVNVQSATVHKSPSTGSPAIGQAPRGTVLEVSRDIGSWVKIVWPDAEGGVGYVHQSKGTIARRSTREERLAAAFVAAPATPTTVPATAATQQVTGGPNAGPQGSGLAGTTYIPTPTHIVGLGGRFGGSPVGDLGVTARVWSRNRFGIQFEALRSSVTSTTAPGQVTSMQFAPSLIYSLRDHVTDNVWVRPYLGAGAVLHRSRLKIGPTDADAIATDSGVGFRTFGGAEVTFPNVPRFAVSADVGYRWSQTTFPGFELGGLGFSVSGHWYVK